MTFEEANLIRQIKKSCTLRKLSETMKLNGYQFEGTDLCREALKILYPDCDIISIDYPGAKFGNKFDDDNISNICYNRYLKWVNDGQDYSKWHEYRLFYWWE